MRKSVSLVIPIYRGGAYWEECFESIRGKVQLFDEVIISINKSELSAKDRAVVNGYESQISVFETDAPMGPIEHFLFYCSKVTSDYAYFLAHDDLFCLESLDPLHRLIDSRVQADIAVMSSYKFFSNAPQSNIDITLSEIQFRKGGMSVQEFIRFDMDKFLDMNISGMVTPTSILKSNLSIFAHFRHGFRADMLLLTLPEISRIHQPPGMEVRIRIHENQAGAQKAPFERSFDNAFYFFYELMNTRNKVLRRRMCQSFVQQLRYLGPKAFLPTAYSITVGLGRSTKRWKSVFVGSLDCVRWSLVRVLKGIGRRLGVTK